MKFWKKPHHKSPDRKLWFSISTNISLELKDLREFWFDYCIKTINHRRQSTNINHVNFNTELKGVADIAIKAYQLYLSSTFIAQHTYIDLSVGKEFADILYAQVCGTEIKECMVYFERYMELNGNSTQLFRFSSDVANYITGKEDITSAMEISMAFPILVNVNHQIISRNFNDMDTVELLKAELEKQFGV